MSREPMPTFVTPPPPTAPAMRCVRGEPLHPGVLYRMGQCVSQAYHAPREEVIDTGKALEKALRAAGLGVHEL